jgi:hypothetical protein
LEPKIQKKHHGEIVKMLLHLMGGQEEPRVRAHAASAVVNFCENLDGNIVGLYLKALLDCFMPLLQSDNRLVVESGLTAMSSVADSAEVCRAAHGSFLSSAEPSCTRPFLFHCSFADYSSASAGNG